MIIHKTFKTQHWSGGTTTELFIYPPQSSLKALDFQFRLSLATIETPESTFTPLLGVHRHFMVLNGNIQLNHKGHHASKVEAFQQDHFEGDWHTESKGTASAFNLMFRDPTNASIEYVRISEGEKISLTLNANSERAFAHLINGQIHLTESSDLLVLEARQLLELDDQPIECLAVEDCDLIVVRLNLQKL